MFKRIIKSKNPNETDKNWKSNFFDIMFEVIAAIDLTTDIAFVSALYKSDEGHNMWFTLTLYSLISPYFVCSIPYLNF